MEEEIYKKQLEGFKIIGKEYVVCKLMKSLYGLSMHLDNSLRNLIPLCLTMDVSGHLEITVFMLNNFMIMIVIIFSLMVYLSLKKSFKIEKLKKELSIDMKDLAPAQHILGMKFFRNRRRRRRTLGNHKNNPSSGYYISSI